MTEVWAHRGASGYAPENTLPAFELALEQGADGFELDVQLTRDDEVVVIHDETLERTTDGHGWVADHSLDDLKKLDASYGNAKYAGTQIPTLAEVFDLVRDSGARVNIELKNSEIRYKGLEERVLALVESHQMASRVVLSSFNHYSLRHLFGLGTTLPLGALYADPLWKPWQYAGRLGATAVHPSVSATRRKIVEKCHEHGLSVHVWTVNEPADLKRLLGLSVDAVITDYPNVARALIG
ncbi:MAG: glycerophosphodiester phosphodiesterase [Propionibacteriaceae bacterium]|nr:glycerophosphodiester phosphodiesterase [Propionibacteriaceae bacterium]